MTQTQEQQKVAEWMIGFGYLPKTSVHFSRFENGEEHIIDKKTATFFYRAAHPEPVAGDGDLGKAIDLIIAHAEQAAIDDKGMFADMDNNLMNRQTIDTEVSSLVKANTQRILDRVEELSPEDMTAYNGEKDEYPRSYYRQVGFNSANAMHRQALDRIRKEEL